MLPPSPPGAGPPGSRWGAPAGTHGGPWAGTGRLRPPGFPSGGSCPACPACPACAGLVSPCPAAGSPVGARLGPGDFPGGFWLRLSGVPSRGSRGCSSARGAGGPRQLPISTTGSAPARTLSRRPAAGAPHAPSPSRDPGQTGTRRGWGSPGAAGDPSCRRAPSSRHRRRLVFSPQLLPGAAAGRTDPSGLALALPEPGRARTGEGGSCCCWGELVSTGVQPFGPAPRHPRRRCHGGARGRLRALREALL